MDDFKDLTGADMLDSDSRQRLIEISVAGGQRRDDVVRYIDTASHAAAEAFKTAFRIATSGPEQDHFATLAVTTKILGNTGQRMFQIMREEASSRGNKGIHP